MTDEGDGSATFTLTIGDDDHRFTAAVSGETALLEYEETLTYRGTIEVSEPDESVFTELMLSEQVTTFLDEHECENVRRANP